MQNMHFFHAMKFYNTQFLPHFRIDFAIFFIKIFYGKSKNIFLIYEIIC